MNFEGQNHSDCGALARPRLCLHIPPLPVIRPFVNESYSLLMKDTPPPILPLLPNVFCVLGHSYLSICLSVHLLLFPT